MLVVFSGLSCSSIATLVRDALFKRLSTRAELGCRPRSALICWARSLWLCYSLLILEVSQQPAIESWWVVWRWVSIWSRIYQRFGCHTHHHISLSNGAKCLSAITSV